MGWLDVMGDDLFGGSMAEWDPRNNKPKETAGGDNKPTSTFVPFQGSTSNDQRWNPTNGSYAVVPDEGTTKLSDNPMDWFVASSPTQAYFGDWNDPTNNLVNNFKSNFYNPEMSGIGNDIYSRGITNWGKSVGQGPTMSVKDKNGTEHRTLLKKDDAGNWALNQGDDALEGAGFMARDQYDGEGKLIGQVLMPTEASRANPGTVGWKGADAFENANDFQRDTYNWLMSDEIQNKLARDYGRQGFENDFAALRADKELRPLYEEYFNYMRDLDKGYFDSVAKDARFLGENGEFDFDPYWSYVDSDANLSDIIAGRGSQEGSDWATGGSFEMKQALADYLSRNPDLAFRIQEIPDEEIASGLTPLDDGYTAMSKSGNRYRVDDEGNMYSLAGSENPTAVKNALTAMFTKDALTNKALDDRYGQYSQYRYTADDLSKIAKFFGQPDIYYTLGSTEKGPDNPYELFGGDPEEWRNFYDLDYPLVFQPVDNKSFRTGATGYAQNNRIGKVNKVQ